MITSICSNLLVMHKKCIAWYLWQPSYYTEKNQGCHEADADFSRTKGQE